MTLEDELNVWLPKWPTCYINGKRINPAQADMVIRRIDAFFQSRGMYEGNLKEWNARVREICRIPKEADFQDEQGANGFSAWWNACNVWAEKWGVLQLSDDNYLSTRRISTSYVGGAHGWLDYDGEIYWCQTIGKYPSAKEIYEELTVLAGAFQFLDLGVTLYSEESGNPSPHDAVISYQVREGEVTVVDPKTRNVHEQYGFAHPVKVRESEQQMIMNLFDRRCEIGCSEERLYQWAHLIYGAEDNARLNESNNSMCEVPVLREASSN